MIGSVKAYRDEGQEKRNHEKQGVGVASGSSFVLLRESIGCFNDEKDQTREEREGGR